MFDFTRLSRICALLFLAYLALFPILAIGLAVAAAVVGGDSIPSPWLGWIMWPGPLVFVLGALALAGDVARRLATGRITSTQLVGYRVAAALQVAGSLFATSAGRWWPLIVCAAVLVGTLLPLRRHTQPSTWEHA